MGGTTYSPPGNGWLYLANLLGTRPRLAVALVLARQRRAELPRDAIATAPHARSPAPGTVCYADRGRRYTAAAYQAWPSACVIARSMSRSGDCLDIATAAS